MATDPEAEAEGEAETTIAAAEAEAEAELATTSSYEPEAEGEGETEPHPESAEPEDWPEPGPEWELAKAEWDGAWGFHVYFFAVAYLLISLVAAYVVVTALAQKGVRSSMRGTSIALSLMILSFAVTRALALLVDPYFSEQLLPFVAVRLLWSFGIPGFTASFSIMLLILLDTTKLSLGPPRFQKVSTVGVIWLLHMVIVLTTDLLVIYADWDARPLLVMCQVLFVLYGSLVSAGFAIVGVRMRGNMKASMGTHQDDQTRRIQRLVTMTMLSSAVAFSVAVVNVYTMVSDFGPYASVLFIKPWPYWAVHTCLRVLEVCACSLVLVLFFRSSRGSDSGSGRGENCWRQRCHVCFFGRKRFVQPLETSSRDTDMSTIPITGVMWRQKQDKE